MLSFLRNYVFIGCWLANQYFQPGETRSAFCNICTCRVDRRRQTTDSMLLVSSMDVYCTVLDILRGTRNLSFVLRRSLLRTFETIWILVITLECSNITASKSIRRERKMRPMELSGVNFSTHGSESECSCFDQVLCIRV